MDTFTIIALASMIFGAALLYSSVGHAGASGYLAAMALFGLAPDVMKPTALALNILVATIASVKYYRAGYFSWPIFWPFALTSVPFAFIGGGITLPSTAYKLLMGLVLLYAAYRLFQSTRTGAQVAQRPLSVPMALVTGAGIGLLSGLTGVGGGIFLSPLLLFTGWAETRQASGIAAVFILVNSMAGLLGNLASVTALPGAILFWAPFAALGGWLGAEYGTRRLRRTVIRQLLSLVLAIAGVKMMLP
ncbi:MAG: sulfite exporter TauE/SafE family protein [Chloroflexi bacterium]|nr:sulfite exporter TauE/SafE family protein [Chloroflexota bacterium]